MLRHARLPTGGERPARDRCQAIHATPVSSCAAIGTPEVAMDSLIISRDKSLRAFIDSLLRSESRIWTAPDLIGADQACSALDLDLIIFDLASFRDVEALALLKKHASRALWLTLGEASDIALEITALQAGADGYLAKPFAGEQFLAHVHALQATTQKGRHGRENRP